MTGPVDRDATVEIGTAEIARPGEDATVLVTQMMRQRVLEAAEQSEQRRESSWRSSTCERWCRSMPTTVGESVARTGRLVCVQECPNFGSWGASIAAQVLADQFDYLDGPPLLIGGDATPIPYARNLEETWIPSVERIVEQIRRMREL